LDKERRAVRKDSTTPLSIRRSGEPLSGRLEKGTLLTEREREGKKTSMTSAGKKFRQKKRSPMNSRGNLNSSKSG